MVVASEMTFGSFNQDLRVTFAWPHDMAPRVGDVFVAMTREQYENLLPQPKHSQSGAA